MSNDFKQDICGSQEKAFNLTQPGKPQIIYTLQVGDEGIVAPLALFHTELLGVTGTGKAAKVQKLSAQQPDSEDCFDAEYLRETGVIFKNVCICTIFRQTYVIFFFNLNRDVEPKNKWNKVKLMVQQY